MQKKQRKGQRKQSGGRKEGIIGEGDKGIKGEEDRMEWSRITQKVEFRDDWCSQKAIEIL